MSRWAVTPMLALLLAGCSSVWVRPPSVDEAQFKQDDAACRAAAFYSPIVPQSTFVGADPYDPNRGLSDVALRNHIREACMEEKGYRKR